MLLNSFSGKHIKMSIQVNSSGSQQGLELQEWISHLQPLTQGPSMPPSLTVSTAHSVQQVASLFLVQHNTWCQDEYVSMSDEQLNSDLIYAKTYISTTFTLTSVQQQQLSS